jgi:hypothetical protein
MLKGELVGLTKLCAKLHSRYQNTMMFVCEKSCSGNCQILNKVRHLPNDPHRAQRCLQDKKTTISQMRTFELLLPHPKRRK